MSAEGSEYTAEVHWTRDGSAQDFAAGRYSRRHRLGFDGGVEVPGSASPHSVPAPWSDPGAVDPEEAFVAALSSCHMLWFLALAAKRGFCVDRYADAAVGAMGRRPDGRLAITRVTLRPEAGFSGARRPRRDEVEQLHEAAHAACYIANSVTSEVRCEPVFDAPGAAP